MPVSRIHEVKPGESLSGIAKKYSIALDDLLLANQQILNPDLIMVGQPVKIPEASSTAAVTLAPGAPASYDGTHPAPGTVSTNRAALITPPLNNSEVSRDPEVYAQVINQFAVGHNPRYLPNHGFTYCNIFLWDVTRAMNVEIPHWIKANGQIAAPFSAGAYEVNINGGVDWMRNFGVLSHGWQSATAEEAQDFANQGKPAVVMWKNPTGGHGHTAVVRPGEITSKGPATAQAGAFNFNSGHMKDGFGNLPGKYFTHE